jgi:hypothetical protein
MESITKQHKSDPSSGTFNSLTCSSNPFKTSKGSIPGKTLDKEKPIPIRESTRERREIFGLPKKY